MNSTKSRIASAVDRARLARLNRSELERSLELARRALQAFGASAGRQKGPEDDGARARAQANEHDAATP